MRKGAHGQVRNERTMAADPEKNQKVLMVSCDSILPFPLEEINDENLHAVILTFYRGNTVKVAMSSGYATAVLGNQLQPHKGLFSCSSRQLMTLLVAFSKILKLASNIENLLDFLPD